MSDLLYLYGFVPADAPAPPDDLAGVAGRPVRLLPRDGFAAVVSRVPSDAYAPEKVEASMHDLAWVGDQGALHERVVTWFVDHADVVPVRLLTLYSGEDALDRELDDRGEGVRVRLDALAGRREWDLKVAYDARVLREHLGELSDEVAQLDREMAAADPGRRYLLARKRDRRLDAAVGSTARRLAREALAAASDHAERVRELPPPPGAVELPVAVRAALLVRRGDEDALRAALQQRGAELDAVGVRLELSGPWAPYRFLEDGPDGAPSPAAGDEA